MRRLRSLPPNLQTLYGGLLIGTAMTVLMLLVLQSLPFFNGAELAAYDFQFQRRGAQQAPSNIVIVGVDQTTLNDLGGRTPLPRHYMASAIDFLHRAGASAILVDFSYFTNSIYGKSDDRALIAAVKRAGNVVLNENFDSAGASSDVVGSSLLTPIPPLGSPGYGRLGSSLVPGDTDNVLRRALLIQRYGFTDSELKLYPGNKATSVPAAPLVLASVALHRPIKQVANGLPNDMLVNYVGPQTADNSQQSWYQVQFDGVARGEDGASLFKNKIVLVIPEYVASNDQHETPFGGMYGGFIQANTLATILRHDPIVPAGSQINGLVILLIGILATAVASRFSIWHSIGIAVVLAIGYPILTIIAFSQYRYWLHLVTPLLTLVFVMAAIMAFRFATEERQKKRAHQKFGLYVKPEIVEIIVNSADGTNTLRGARRQVSALFADIRGFTAMSELMQPEDVISLLDIYLEELTASVQQCDGTVDKYVGDEIMAIWNAPRLQPDHPLLAVKSAMEMVNRMEKINREMRARNLPLIGFGIGVNTGEGIVGEMGSSFRKQYDVVGDCINTAARLCSAAGRGEIIIGQATWEQIGEWLEVEETEPLKLKGKSQPLRTFRVISIRETPIPAAENRAVTEPVQA